MNITIDKPSQEKVDLPQTAPDDSLQERSFFEDMMVAYGELSEWARGERELRVTTVEEDEDDPLPPSYFVVFQPGAAGWTAMVPDLPGVTATGVEQWQAEEGIQEAIARFVAGATERGEDAPAAKSWGKKVPILPLSEFE